ncbi:DNA replication terminus site binding protein [Kushneria sinocarnis]|uniref:DNA replication terminus site binding protein n=1 Tax=Kushneria sinocarnis TaxID=595502 RepID=A0A420WYQ9_9GAMM|nr:DNA replication terminus site-binding protein [Kushneria sinocarnis]RKR06374.1 DNA replication terminus site binding protein [Kushneria sinocarnis]
MTLQYQLLAELEHAFDALVDSTEALLAHCDRQWPAAWALGTQPADSQWLRRALTDFWYQDGQDGRTTRNYIGLVVADAVMLEEVARINRCKDHFAALLEQIRRDHPAMVPEIKATLPFRHPVLHDHLRGEGLARLHLKQCWRHIPVAEAPVARVRMAWYSSGRSIKRLTVSEVEEKLSRLNNEAAHVRIQWQKLAGLPSGEILAQVQQQAPLMRANLFYREPLEDGRTRRALNVPLPVFLPAEDNRLPQVNQPPEHPPEKRTRALRGDAKLESEPFIPSLRVYRYRQRN